DEDSQDGDGYGEAVVDEVSESSSKRQNGAGDSQECRSTQRFGDLECRTVCTLLIGRRNRQHRRGDLWVCQPHAGPIRMQPATVTAMGTSPRMNRTTPSGPQMTRAADPRRIIGSPAVNR